MTQSIAALVGSRICHDLISPIGAINNGVELLNLTHAQPTEELSLIAESAESATARVMFFRVAYGGASEGQMIRSSEIKTILEKVSETGKCTYEWDSQPSIPRNFAKLIFLSLQCIETCLPAGGTIIIRQDGDRWVLTTKSATLQFDAELWAGLSGPSPHKTYTSAEVQFALLPAALNDATRNLSYEHEGDSLVVRI